MMEKTEWFEFVDDDDMQVQESYHSMIMYCQECRCFFWQKACGCRTIFAGCTVYHPTDGNIVIMKDDTAEGRERKMVATCECEHHPIRLRSVAQLENAITEYNEGMK